MYELDAITKNDDITVRVWKTSLEYKPMLGHCNFKFSWEQAPSRAIAKSRAINLLKFIALKPQLDDETIFFDGDGCTI